MGKMRDKEIVWIGFVHLVQDLRNVYGWLERVEKIELYFYF